MPATSTPSTIGFYRDVTGHCWVCDMALDAESAQVLELFGTTILPMPFTLQADASVVRATLQRLHPSAVISRLPDVHQPGDLR